MLIRFHAIVMEAVVGLLMAVANNAANIVAAAINMQKEFTAIINPVAVHASQRLVASEQNRIAGYTIDIGIAEKLQRFYFFAKCMAEKTIFSKQLESICTLFRRTVRRCK